MRLAYARIRADNLTAADRFVDMVSMKASRLGEFPLSGVLRDDLRPGVRQIVCGRYLILYRVLPDRVEILAVAHSAQDSASLLDD